MKNVGTREDLPPHPSTLLLRFSRRISLAKNFPCRASWLTTAIAKIANQAAQEKCGGQKSEP